MTTDSLIADKIKKWKLAYNSLRPDEHEMSEPLIRLFLEDLEQLAREQKPDGYELLKETLRVGVNIGMQNVEQPRWENDFNFNQKKSLKECQEYLDKIQPKREQKPDEVTVELLEKDGWVKNGEGYEKSIPNRNPLNNSEDTEVKLILHQMYNTPYFAILLPDGGMLNFVANTMDELKGFESRINFYDAPY